LCLIHVHEEWCLPSEELEPSRVGASESKVVALHIHRVSGPCL
jgi:hypothetical protein